MAIVINSKFRPFSYDDMLKVVLPAAEEHRKIDEELGNIDTMSSVWEKLKDSDMDKDVYNQYQNFQSGLQSAIDDLARNGLNASSRRSLGKMKARYAKEITPIEEAWNERNRQFKMQQELAAKDPTRRYKTRANTVGLKEYMNGNYDALSANFSGVMLADQASNIAKNFKTVMRKPGAFESLGLPYQYKQKFQTGYTPEEVDMAINNPANADPILVHIIDQVMQANGIDESWGNLSNEARRFIGEGVYNAIGTSDYKYFKDDYGMQSALNAQKFQYDLRLRELAKKDAEDKAKTIRMAAINPLNIYSNNELTQAREDIQKYDKFFVKDKDGNIIGITQKGLDEYNKTGKYNYVGPGGVPMQGEQNSGFRNFMNKITGNNNILENGKYTAKSRDLFINSYSKYISDHNTEMYDTHKATEFDYRIKDSDAKDYKKAILTALHGQDLKEVDYDNKSRSFKPTGKKLTVNDLNSDDYIVTSTRFTSQGATVMVKDKEGNVKRYEMPTGINTDNENNRNSAMTRAELYRSILNSNDISSINISPLRSTLEEERYNRLEQRLKSGIPLTQNEKDVIESWYTGELDNAYMYHSQLGVTNTTKEQEYQPYGY